MSIAGHSTDYQEKEHCLNVSMAFAASAMCAMDDNNVPLCFYLRASRATVGNVTLYRSPPFCPHISLTLAAHNKFCHPAFNFLPHTAVRSTARVDNFSRSAKEVLIAKLML